MDTLARLIDALRCLPGVGPKSAQRMAFHLLQHHRTRGLKLAECLAEAMQVIGHCKQCNDYTDVGICNRCQNRERDNTLICVVETPADIQAIEQSHAFVGQYYVLMGKISPLDGIGPEDIALEGLKQRIQENQVTEVILALSPTVEGQTTTHFIQSMLAQLGVKLSQLAHGIPVGGELDLLDSNTISRALLNRGALQSLVQSAPETEHS